MLGDLMATSQTELYQNLIRGLSELYWLPPTKESITAFKPLMMESLGLKPQDVEALNTIIDNLDDASRKDISVDYSQLFYGFDPKGPFPYESIFIGEQRLLMQEATGEVKKIYDANGFAPDASVSNEPPDHLTHELRYVAFLLERADSARAQGELQQAEVYKEKKDAFLRDHLQEWTPLFFDAVRQRAQTEFFKLVVSLTEQALIAVEKL